MELDEVPITHDITIPRDSAILRMPIEIDRDVGKVKPTKAEAQGKRSQVSVEITEDGELIAQALCDEYKEQITVLERTIREYEEVEHTYKEKERSMSELIRHLKSAVIICIFAFVACVVIAVYKFIKDKLWQKK